VVQKSQGVVGPGQSLALGEGEGGGSRLGNMEEVDASREGERGREWHGDRDKDRGKREIPGKHSNSSRGRRGSLGGVRQSPERHFAREFESPERNISPAGRAGKERAKDGPVGAAGGGRYVNAGKQRIESDLLKGHDAGGGGGVFGGMGGLDSGAASPRLKSSKVRAQYMLIY